MQVTVRLFAGLRERAQTDSIVVTLPDGADGARGLTVQDAINAASATVPAGLQIRGHIMLALNREYVEADHPVSNGDELALVPPVSGGAPLQTGLPEKFQNVLITGDPLDPEPFTRHVTTDEDGAIVTFLGVSRDHNAGRRVEYLEYEAYRPMADEQINAIIGEMKARWEIGRVAVAHRTGRVDVGETSMVVAVGAPHRKPAFEAALYFVDRLKEIVPIWKKEFFKGGEVWIGETPGGGPGE
jgi:molybdopterin converting factor subunit 1